MENKDFGFLRHMGASLLAGFLFSLFVGVIFSLKMIGINEATHQFHYAYLFALNFIPMYLLLGVVFGLSCGILGGLISRNATPSKGWGVLLPVGLGWLIFVVVFLILRAPLGAFCGMLLAILILVATSGLRPAPARLYFTAFLTGIAFNYSWQWVRQHFIINPLLPVQHSQATDLIFTLVWALLFLLGYRIFLKALLKLPIRVFYSLEVAIVILALAIGGVYYFIQPKPVIAESRAPNPITPLPTDRKVILIGIDGLWWKVLDPLLEQGRTPNLQKLVENGTSGPLATLYPTFSAAIWTSISTGKTPEKHGVTSFLVWKFPWSGFALPCFQTPKITAEMDWMREHLVIVAPMTNQFLDAKPIWEILSEHGVSVGLLNWWVSYPATPLNGFNVTDHCLFNKEYIMENFKRREGDTIYDIYPLELLEELKSFSRSPDDLTDDEIRRFIHVEDPEFLQEFRAIDTYDYLDIAYEASMFKYSYPEDATIAPAARYLVENHPTDFFCVYLDGMDSMQHQYLKYYFADQHPDKLIPKNLTRYRDLIVNYYLYMDEVVGTILEAAQPNSVVMIVSDHGFDEIMLPTGHYNHMNAPPGVFICAGPGIKAGYKIEDAGVLDITPTILHLLGLPNAEDFDGKPLMEMMTDSLSPGSVDTYETGCRAGHTVIQTELDQGYKEKLKALGYTQ